MTNETQLIDLTHAATMLGVTVHTARRWVRLGRLKGYKLGGRTYRIKRSDVRAFIEASEVEAV